MSNQKEARYRAITLFFSIEEMILSFENDERDANTDLVIITNNIDNN